MKKRLLKNAVATLALVSMLMQSMYGAVAVMAADFSEGETNSEETVSYEYEDDELQSSIEVYAEPVDDSDDYYEGEETPYETEEEQVPENLDVLSNQISGSGLNSVSVRIDTSALKRGDTFRIIFTGSDDARYDTSINDSFDYSSGGTYTFENLNNEGFNIRAVSDDDVEFEYFTDGGMPVISAVSMSSSIDKTLTTKSVSLKNGKLTDAITGEGFENVNIDLDTTDVEDGTSYIIYVDTVADVKINGEYRSEIEADKTLTSITLDNLDEQKFTVYVSPDEKSEMVAYAVINSEEDGSASFILDGEVVSTKKVYTYEDDDVSVTATLQIVDAVPDDAEFVVTAVTEGPIYEAYMEALKTKADDGVDYTEENTLLYDIAFIVEEDGVKKEYEPANGAVTIEIKFKKSQISEDLGADANENVVLNHLPVDEEIVKEAGTTLEATDVSVSDIQIEPVTTSTVDIEGYSDSVELTLDSFSLISITHIAPNSVGAINFDVFKALNDNHAGDYGIVAGSIDQKGDTETNYFVGTLNTNDRMMGASGNYSNGGGNNYIGKFGTVKDNVISFYQPPKYVYLGQEAYNAWQNKSIVITGQAYNTANPVLITEYGTEVIKKTDYNVDTVLNAVNDSYKGLKNEVTDSASTFYTLNDDGAGNVSITESENKGTNFSPEYKRNSEGKYNTLDITALPEGTYVTNIKYNTDAETISINGGEMALAIDNSENHKQTLIINFDLPATCKTFNLSDVKVNSTSYKDAPNSSDDEYTTCVVYNFANFTGNLNITDICGVVIAPKATVDSHNGGGVLVAKDATTWGEWHYHNHGLETPEGCSVQFKIKKILKDNQGAKDTFTFKLYETDSCMYHSNRHVASGHPDSKLLQTIEIPASEFSTVDGIDTAYASFASIPYSKDSDIGTHYYVIEEVEKQGWEVKNKEYFVNIIVKVKKNGNKYELDGNVQASFTGVDNRGNNPTLQDPVLEFNPADNEYVFDYENTYNVTREPAKVRIKATKYFEGDFPDGYQTTLRLVVLDPAHKEAPQNDITGIGPMPEGSTTGTILLPGGYDKDQRDYRDLELNPNPYTNATYKDVVVTYHKGQTSVEADFGEIAFPFYTPEGERDIWSDHPNKYNALGLGQEGRCRCYMYKVYEVLPNELVEAIKNNDTSKFEKENIEYTKWYDETDHSKGKVTQWYPRYKFKGIDYDGKVQRLKFWVHQIHGGVGQYRAVAKLQGSAGGSDCQGDVPEVQFTNRYISKPVQLKIDGNKTVNGKGSSDIEYIFNENNKITFKLRGESVDGDVYSIPPMPSLAGKERECTYDIDSDDWHFDFGEILFSSACVGHTYVYKVTESSGNSDLGKSEQEYTITVKVTESNGKVIATYSCKDKAGSSILKNGSGASVDTLQAMDNGDNKIATITADFDNTLSSEVKLEFSATKSFTGRALGKDEFMFRVEGTAESGATAKQPGAASGYSTATIGGKLYVKNGDPDTNKTTADAKFTPVTFTLNDRNKQFTYTIEEYVPDDVDENKVSKSNGITYDTRKYELTFTPKIVGNKLVLSDAKETVITYKMIDGVWVEDSRTTKDVTLSPNNDNVVVFNEGFSNSYLAEGDVPIRIKKVVEGSVPDKTFNFKAKLSAKKDGDTEASEITVPASAKANQYAEFGTMKFSSSVPRDTYKEETDSQNNIVRVYGPGTYNIEITEEIGVDKSLLTPVNITFGDDGNAVTDEYGNIKVTRVDDGQNDYYLYKGILYYAKPVSFTVTADVVASSGTMSVEADYADETEKLAGIFKNLYTVSKDEAEIPVKKTYSNNISKDQFTFILEGLSVDDDTDNKPPMPVTTDERNAGINYVSDEETAANANIRKIATIDGGKTEELRFGVVDYNKAGKYSYKVIEYIPGSDRNNNVQGGVTYDKAEYIVDIEVYDNREGELEHEIKMKKDGSPWTSGSCDFDNTMTEPGSIVLKATKQLINENGTVAVRGFVKDEFTFGIYEKVNESDLDKNKDTYIQKGGQYFRLLKKDGVDYTATNDTDGTPSSVVTFPGISYSLEELGGLTSKTFTYYIIEDASAHKDYSANAALAKDGYTYDDTLREVNVTVSVVEEGGVKKVQPVSDASNASTVVFSNQYDAEGNQTIMINKKLLGIDLEKLGISEDNPVTFTFEITPDASNPSNDPKVSTVDTNKTGTDGVSVTFKSIAEAQEGKNIPFNFSYRNVKTGENQYYYYTLTEKASGITGVIDDTKVFDIRVSVSDGGLGVLSVSVESKLKEESDDKYSAASTFNYVNTTPGAAVIKAVKSLTPASLDISKYAFTFTLTELKADGTRVPVPDGRKDNDGSEVVFNPISYTKDHVGTHIYEIEEDKTGITPTADGKYVKNNIVYSTAKFYAKVIVGIDASGALTVSTPKYYSNAACTEDETSDYASLVKFENKYEAEVPVLIKGTKKLHIGSKTGNEIAVPDGMFGFKLYEVTKDGVKATAVPDAKNIGNDYKFIDPLITDGEYTFKYTQDDLTVDKKIDDNHYQFNYRIVEDTTVAKPGYEFDDSQYGVTVDVYIKSDGSLVLGDPSDITDKSPKYYKPDSNEAVNESWWTTFTNWITGNPTTAQFDNTYDAKGSLQLEVQKILANIKAEDLQPTDKTFSFSLYRKDASFMEVVESDGVWAAIKNLVGAELPKVAEVSIEGSGSATILFKDAEGNFTQTEKVYTFADLTKDTADGIYKTSEQYMLVEDQPTEDKTNGITYSKAVYDIDVSVVDDGKGMLDVSADIMLQGSDEKITTTIEEVTKGEGENKVVLYKICKSANIPFTNTYAPDPNKVEIPVSKLFTGASLFKEDGTLADIYDEDGNQLTNFKFKIERVGDVPAGVKDGNPTFRPANPNADDYTGNEVFKDEINISEDTINHDANTADLQFGPIWYTLDDLIRNEDGTYANTSYLYKVTEVIGDESQIIYDKSEYYVVVEITDVNSGKLQPTAYYANEKGEKLLANDQPRPVSAGDPVSFRNDRNNGDAKEFYVKKILEGANAASDEDKSANRKQFTFDLYDGTVTIDENGVVTGTKLDTVTAFAGDSPQKFTNYKFECNISKLRTDLGNQKPGAKSKDYIFTIVEVNPGDEKYTYSTDVWEATVTVSENADGTLTMDGPRYALKGSDVTSNAYATFKNYYNADGHAHLAFTKNMTGRDMTGGEFSFYVFDEDVLTNEAAAPIATRINAGDVRNETFNVYGKQNVYGSKDTQHPEDSEELEQLYYTMDTLKIDENENYNSVAYKYYAILEDIPVNKDDDGKYIKDGVTYDNNVYVAIVKLEDKGIENGDIDVSPAKYMAVSTENTVVESEEALARNIRRAKDAISQVKNANEGAAVEKGALFNRLGETATLNNSYAAEGEIEFDGMKILTNKTAELQGGEFTFKIYDKADPENKFKITTNDASGYINFDDVDFLHYTLDDAGKTFTYVVEEVIPTRDEDKQQGVIYTTEPIREFEVTVTDNKTGSLTVTSVPNNKSVVVDDTAYAFKFENTYHATGFKDLYGTKTMKNKKLGVNDKFSFTISYGTHSETVWNTEDGTKDTEAIGRVKFDHTKIDFLNYDEKDVGSEFTYTITENPSEINGISHDRKEYKITVKVEDTHVRQVEDDPFSTLVARVIKSEYSLNGGAAEDYKFTESETDAAKNYFAFENTYKADSTLDILGYKHLKRNINREDVNDKVDLTDRFSFYLYEYTNNDRTGSRVSVYDAPAKTDKDGNFKFAAPIKYTEQDLKEGSEYKDSVTKYYRLEEYKKSDANGRWIGEGDDRQYVLDGVIYTNKVHDFNVTISTIDDSDSLLVELTNLDGSSATLVYDEAAKAYVLVDPYEFTNVEPEYTQVTVQKRWNASDTFIPAERPNVEIALYASTKDSEPAPTGKTATLTAPYYTYTFKDLDVLSEAGNEITYSIVETDVPGYYLAGTVVTKDEDTNSYYVELNNIQGDIFIHKYEAGTTNELAGATLAIYTLDGKEIEKWVSTGFAHKVETKLTPGSTYILRELAAPEGYILAADKEFKVRTDASYADPQIEMLEDPKIVGSVHLRKLDADTREALAGAEFAVYRADGTRVYASGSAGAYRYSESSSNGRFMVDGRGVLDITDIPYGTYYFEEIAAPAGYELNPERLGFSVLTNGEVVEVSFLNTKIRGSVTLRKTNADGSVSLAGAVFELYARTPRSASDAIASTIYRDAYYRVGTYTTDASGSIYVGDLPWDDYYFIEVEAPEGYEVNRDVNGDPVVYRFSIDSATARAVTYDLGSITNDTTPPPTGRVLGTPRDTGRRLGGVLSGVLGVRAAPDSGVLGERVGPVTGDTANMILWLLLLVACLGTIIGMVAKIRKREKMAR